MIELAMTCKMESRFLDRRIADALDEVVRVSFAVSGAAVMTTARRSLKGPLQKPLAQLTDSEREWYNARMKAYRERREVRVKPRRPDRVSLPGRPPLLHSPRSVLKYRLLFALNEDSTAVVVGPELLGRNRRAPRGLSTVEELEKRRPFMAPALEKVAPRIPSYVSSALSRVKVKGF